MTINLVPRAGIEPATLGLEVLCSIQLSYRGIHVIIAYSRDMTKAHRSIILILAIIILNIIDAILHIVTGQPEFLRITSNLVIIISGLLLIPRPRYAFLFTIALSLYTTLNTLFILFNGIGTAGAALIAGTILLGIFILHQKTHQIS